MADYVKLVITLFLIMTPAFIGYLEARPQKRSSCAARVKLLLKNATNPPLPTHSRCVKNTVAIKICNHKFNAVVCKKDDGCSGRPAKRIRVQCTCVDNSFVLLTTECESK
ncbi:uncharacterized protein LOC114962809 [Acropora millepora]|uniref:uncharacterized protein LOC114962809 n=1 Tax=Acropora millepora TaxID=45264 RepID=UPI0010FC826E|nr:uncharacterized protein LOC114962809 [Acropora millepora]